MGSAYHQFCPVAKAMEILDDRWTMLVIRELAQGSERFNDLRNGLPRMSPTLLSKRLQQLTRAGIVERRAGPEGVTYRLTPAGRELRPVVEAIGCWGIRWIGELGDADLDPKLLLWDIHRHVDQAAVPRHRTVLQFTFPDRPASDRHWWLVITPTEVDVCDRDPGHEVSVTIVADLRSMTAIWRGDLTWSQAMRSKALTMYGPERLRRAVPRWLTLSGFASAPRSSPLPP